MAVPKIACISVIGKADNPLHISLFPPYLNSNLEFSFLLNASLDIFETRQKQTSIDQDLGLLHAVDEKLASYGWLTTTGVKILVIVDLVGEQMLDGASDIRKHNKSTLKDSDLKPVFRAVQTAYIQLLQNPFYCPDQMSISRGTVPAAGSQPISDQKFITEVKRIGSSWVPGLTAL